MSYVIFIKVESMLFNFSIYFLKEIWAVWLVVAMCFESHPFFLLFQVQARVIQHILQWETCDDLNRNQTASGLQAW